MRHPVSLGSGYRCITSACVLLDRLAIACRRFDGGEGELQRIAKGGGRTHFTDISAQLDKRPRHIGRDPRDDAIASHQPGSLSDPDEIVCHCGIDGDDAADIHDEHARTALSNARQRLLHDVLCALRVHNSNQGEQKNTLPD